MAGKITSFFKRIPSVKVRFFFMTVQLDILHKSLKYNRVESI